MTADPFPAWSARGASAPAPARLSQNMDRGAGFGSGRSVRTRAVGAKMGRRAATVIDKTKTFAICVFLELLLRNPRRVESRKGAENMKNHNKNKGRNAASVARVLPIVAQMLPSGCPFAAGKLPDGYPQVANPLP